MKWIVLFLLALMLASCDTVWDEPLAVDTDLPDTEGFYTLASGDFSLRYKVVQQDLECILQASSSGWLAVGFAPTSQMKDANFIIGYVNGGVGFIRDDFGDSNTSHAEDISAGGNSNVNLLASSENAGNTILHFRIPLTSGDSKDRDLVVGNSYPIIFAKGDEDDFESYHSGIGTGTIRIR